MNHVCVFGDLYSLRPFLRTLCYCAKPNTSRPPRPPPPIPSITEIGDGNAGGNSLGVRVRVRACAGGRVCVCAGAHFGGLDSPGSINPGRIIFYRTFPAPPRQDRLSPDALEFWGTQIAHNTRADV